MYLNINYFKKHSAKKVDYSVLTKSPSFMGTVYPLLRDFGGSENLYSVSILHGRSFVVNQDEQTGLYTILKGCGLSYTRHPFINTKENGKNTWGILLQEDGLRDFNNGCLVANLGIKTNRMQCVIKLEEEIVLNTNPPVKINPSLLQYEVECPLRIEDASFYPKDIIRREAEKWRATYKDYSSPLHCIAAKMLVKNLRILHHNNILHNAISPHNYTWALELVDFEMTHSKQFPYDKTMSEENIQSLYPREIMYTYQIIQNIAQVLGEKSDEKQIEEIFIQNNFDLSKYSIKV